MQPRPVNFERVSMKVSRVDGGNSPLREPRSNKMTYLSTRGGEKGVSFIDAVLRGLAEDGGLFIPESIPRVADEEKTAWRGLSYGDLALRILSLYISDEEIPRKELSRMVSASYAPENWRADDCVKLKELGQYTDYDV